ncbi:MAG: hypothetical protein K9I71_05900 [Ignavibacteriales bacterium]|nr:hypothetical protein [Ignavibacteriales bacterium]MCF8315637.1 hypothetical protein [Ignavibacteriales bacterium]MCF8437169.1 hypothetical protein [Ignavibacteriales bacterium]
MTYTRIFTGADGEAHFEEIYIPMNDSGEIGSLSEMFPVSGIIFRENQPGYDYDFHNAPARQFIVLLEGAIEIISGTGQSRRFYEGDIILVEDTEGRGHRSRSLDGKKRKSIFITLD